MKYGNHARDGVKVTCPDVILSRRVVVIDDCNVFLAVILEFEFCPVYRAVCNPVDLGGDWLIYVLVPGNLYILPDHDVLENAIPVWSHGLSGDLFGGNPPVNVSGVIGFRCHDTFQYRHVQVFQFLDSTGIVFVVKRKTL